MITAKQVAENASEGTQGPWEQSHREGRDGLFRTQVYELCSPDNTIATIHWHSIKVASGFTTDRENLAIRIASVPDMEALIAEQAARLELAMDILGQFADAADELDESEMGEIGIQAPVSYEQCVEARDFINGRS